MGPPDNVLAEAVPLNVLLARTDSLALTATGGLAYETGWQFTLVLLRRVDSDDEWDVDPFYWHPRARRGGIRTDMLRFGLQLADGRKVTNLEYPNFGRAAEPPGPVLMPRGGGGGGRRSEQSFWAWPLPPPGPLAFVCEWPSQGIDLTRVEVDSELIRNAASRAQVLWPDHGGDGGWETSQFVLGSE